LPADWKPTLEAAKFARSLGLDVDAVADQFRDYWIAKAGSGAIKLDWLATWRNWCRENAQRQINRPALSAKSWQQKSPDAPPETEWWPRLRTYKPGGWWSPMWGPRPESGQSFVPKDILARWKAGGE
jgi:hypothetical protein